MRTTTSHRHLGSPHPTAGWRRHRVIAGFVASLALGLAACSSGGDADDAADRPNTTSTTTAATSTTRTRTTTVPTEPGECPSEGAVAGVVGGAVDRSTSFGGGTVSGAPDGQVVSVSRSGCSYDVVEGPDGSVRIVWATESTVDQEPGPTGSALFDLLAQASAADSADNGFEGVGGIGDQAYRSGRMLILRRGNTVVVAEVEDEDDLRAATTLARAALAADPPPAVDAVPCDRFSPVVADALDAEVTGTGSTMGASLANDTTMSWQGCTFDLDDGRTASLAAGSAENWDAWVAAKLESPFSITHTDLTIGEHAAFDDGEQLVVDAGDQPLIITTSGDDLGPDQATLRVDLARLVLGA